MNTKQMSPGAQFSTLLSRFPSKTAALAKQCLSRLRRAIPCTHEVVYDYTKSVVVSLSLSERGYEALAALSIAPDEVRLYLDKSLPDPKGLLEGAGSKVRSFRVVSAAHLDDQDVRALINAALERAGVIASRAGKRQVIFKTKSKKPAAAKSTTKPPAGKALRKPGRKVATAKR